MSKAAVAQEFVLASPTARVFQPVLTHTGRYIGLKGGRGSGKSHFVGEELVLDAVANHVRCVCGREVQNSIADSSKQLLEDKIHKLAGTLETKRQKDFLRNFKITDTEIVYRPTDSLFIFRGLLKHTVSSIKSLEGYNRFWGEEAQTVSQKSIDLVTPTFRVPGSKMYWTWNPVSPKDPVDKLFRENEGDPDFLCITANYGDNPWFPDDLRRDMERDRRRDPSKYAHVWLGKYQTMSEARVFKNWRELEFETPKGARFYFGADWGFSVDPAVAIRCWVGRLVNGVAIPDEKGDVLFVDHEAYEVGCEIDHTPALFAGDDKQTPKRWENPKRHKGIPGATEWPMTADSARPETISYMRRHGFPRIKPSVKGAGSVEDGIEFLRAYDIVVHPRCTHTIDELSTYSYKIDSRTGEILPVLEDKKNHVIDALRYALESTRRGSYTLASVG